MNKTIILNFFRKLLFQNSLAEHLLYYFTNGKSLNAFAAKIPPNYYQYPTNSIRKIKRNEINYILDISDYMEWLIYFGIVVEPRKSLYALAKEANVIFDIGANVGETTLNIAKIAGESSLIYSFEPSELCYKKLKANIDLNIFKNIKLHQFGFGEQEQTFYLAPDVENNRGGNRIRVNSELPHNIKIKQLDNYVKESDILNIDLIKIDVEGFEFNVLKGAIRTIEKMRPTLFIELNNDNLKQQNTNAKELISFLEQYYSNIYNAESKVKISSKCNLENCHIDIIAKN